MANEPMNDNAELSLKLLVVLSKAYKSVMDKALKDIKKRGLSPSEFGILEVLHAKGKIPIQQIGGKILITSGTMTYNIDKLEKKELLKRIPCADDRRVVFAELTPKGKQFIEDIFPQHAASIRKIMSGLSDRQKEETIELLKLLGKGVYNHDDIQND